MLLTYRDWDGLQGDKRDADDGESKDYFGLPCPVRIKAYSDDLAEIKSALSRLRGFTCPWSSKGYLQSCPE